MGYILTIPKPCSENWNKMTPTQKGAFCKSCQKEVIDFSQTGTHALTKRLSQGRSICGRFRPDQLNHPISTISETTWKRHAVYMGFTSLVLLSTPVIAQIEKPNIAEILQHKMPICGLKASGVKLSDSIVLKGLVEDMESPLPGALIMIKGTTIGTQTDFDGNFTLKVPTIYQDEQLTLVFSYIGYETMELKIDAKSKFVNAKFTEESYAIMGEVVIRRMNFIRRIGNWFRRF